jgi:hypothetical protein
MKNLLDWPVGGDQLYEEPVAWLDVANPGRGDGARAQLRAVIGYVGYWRRGRRRYSGRPARHRGGGDRGGHQGGMT